jgi:hypothetical protein
VKTFLRVLVIGMSFLLLCYMAAMPLAVAGTSGGDFTWRTQTIIRGLRWIEPLLRIATILALFFGARTRPTLDRQRWLLGAAIMLVIGVIGVLTNYQADARILAWNPNAPPSGWEAMRDGWSRWHLACIANSVFTLGVAIAVTKTPNQSLQPTGASARG